MNLLADIVASILLKGDCRISQIADGLNSGRDKQESKEKQVHRFFENMHITHRVHYLPYIQEVLEQLKKEGLLHLIIDGSSVGSGCMVLMFSVLHRGRAIPLAWSVKRKPKGHFKEEEHIELLGEVVGLMPAGAEVTVLGDGEFDGVRWQEEISSLAGWSYVLRTSSNLLLEDEEGERFKPSEVPVASGEGLFLESLKIGKDGYGPVNMLVWHEKGHESPLYLVTDKDDLGAVAQSYIRRFYIETFFRDIKSMGYHVNRSRIRSPEKLSRLILCCCLAYVLTIMAGIKCKKSIVCEMVKSGAENALSLFQMGLRFIQKLIDLRQWRAFSWKYDFRSG